MKSDFNFIYKKANLVLFIILMTILLCSLVLNVKSNRIFLFNWELPDISYSSFSKNFPSYGLTRAFILLIHGDYTTSITFNRNAINFLVFILLNLLMCMVSFFTKSKFYPFFHFNLFFLSYIGLLRDIMKLYFLL
jgi:hypothetical protein